MAATFDLARFYKQLDDGYDRHDACRAGTWLHRWHMAPDHSERVTRREFASEAAAKTEFRAFVAQYRKAKYEERGKDDYGWTIDTRGRRGSYRAGGLGGGRPWGPDVVVETIKLGKKPVMKRTTKPIVREPDRAAIAKLAKVKPPATADIATLIDATNAWFAALVAAGMDLDPFGGAKIAIATSGAYTAAAIEAAGLPLPASFVAVLRSHGDLSVAGITTTYPLAKRAKWPLRRTLADESRVLAWEIENHAGKQTSALRFAAKPGDHFYTMDGETIRRVPDIDLPTETDETTRTVRAWLHARVRDLHAKVKKLT